MRFRDILGLIYGTLMGTSTVLIKSKREYFFEAHEENCGPWRLGIGGQCNLGEVAIGEARLIVNRERETPQKFFSDSTAKTIAIETRLTVRSDETKNNHSPVRSDFYLPEGFELWTYRFSRFFGGSMLADRVHRVVFTGPLVFNKIHPNFFLETRAEFESWLKALAWLSENFKDFSFVPEEGAVGNVNVVLQFNRYLQDFADPMVEYSTLVSRYADVREIIGNSSLAEVLDHLRALG